MGARELGNPMGNPLALPKKAGGAKAINPTIVDFVNGASGDFVLPDGYSFFRVTAVGGGAGGADLGNGGGGGGLSRSPILPVTRGLVISYLAGIGGAKGSPGGTSIATFGSNALSATGGTIPLGGVGSGGVDNFQGGAGGASNALGAGGGGAAGPTSNGGNGSTLVSTPGGSSVDGGGGGCGGNSSRGGSGGGGVMALGGAAYNTLGTANSLGGTTREYWGGAGGFGNANGTFGVGGNWGGGGGASGNNSATYPGAPGGYGGVRIELW